MRTYNSSISFLKENDVYNAMNAMRAKGWSNKKIAYAFGCCHETVISFIGKEPSYITSATQKKARAARVARITVE